MEKSAKFKKPDVAKSKQSKTVFLISEAQAGFFYLQKAFTKVSILYHFDLECHIRSRTDVAGYATSEVFSQIASNQ